MESKLSFSEAIKFTYSDEVANNFSLIRTDTKEEKLAYYYLENALFRTSSLWDMLAQLYRLYFDINIPKEKVYYKQIFNPTNNHSNNFKIKATEIFNILNNWTTRTVTVNGKEITYFLITLEIK
ncbi:MAG: Cthe_2314 family HEPN domain-containing protein [Clostridia bacterium]